jgi:putative SOS response-associated peptidase YedK
LGCLNFRTSFDASDLHRLGDDAPNNIDIDRFRRQQVDRAERRRQGWHPVSGRRAATYNTRDNTVEKSGLWRKIWKRNRCLIPVSGFYDWHHREGKPKKEPPQPYYFTDAHGAPALTIAGIFDRWNDPENEGRELLSCSMMTTAPTAHVAKVHDRQVVTVDETFSPNTGDPVQNEKLHGAITDLIARSLSSTLSDMRLADIR